MRLLKRLIFYDQINLTISEKIQGNNYGTQIIKGGISLL